jgi:hypothetical protein
MASTSLVSCGGVNLLHCYGLDGPLQRAERNMKDFDKNYGVIIAFLLPGFLLLWGLSFSIDAVASWLSKAGDEHGVTVGGFLYSTLASLASGLLLSAVRWLFIDHVMWLINVRDRGMNFSRLSDKDRYAAFSGVVENHYRYYQYYSNTLIALICFFAVYVYEKGNPGHLVWGIGIAVAFALFLAARDALKKYYDRALQILS